MTIETMGPAHVHDVARLHCESLTGLVTALGEPAARAYYRGAVTSPDVLAFVALDGVELAGFVLGSRAPGALPKAAFAGEPLGCLAAIAMGVARRPVALGWLFSTLRGPAGDPFDAGVPELTYLAVSSDVRGAGHGRELVEAYRNGLLDAGRGTFELSVDAANASAIAFYERLGLTRVGRYRQFGAEHLRMRLEAAAKSAVD